jgi:hypothetical protein
VDNAVWVGCGFAGLREEGCREMEDKKRETKGRAEGKEPGGWNRKAGWGDIKAGTCIIFRLPGSGVGIASA